MMTEFYFQLKYLFLSRGFYCNVVFVVVVFEGIIEQGKDLGNK